MMMLSWYDTADKTMIFRAALVWLAWIATGGARRGFVEPGEAFETEGGQILTRLCIKSA
jgi:hypothetical protein